MDLVKLFLALVVLCSVTKGQQVEETKLIVNPPSHGQSSSGTILPPTPPSGGIILSTLSQPGSTTRHSTLHEDDPGLSSGSGKSTVMTAKTTTTTTVTTSTTDHANPASQPQITTLFHDRLVTLSEYSSSTDRSGFIASSISANHPDVNWQTTRQSTAVKDSNKVGNVTTQRTMSLSELPKVVSATGDVIAGSVTPSVDLSSGASKNRTAATSTMSAQNNATDVTNLSGSITTRSVPSRRKTAPTPPTPPIPSPTPIPASIPTLSAMSSTELSRPNAGQKLVTTAATYSRRSTTSRGTATGSRTAVTHMPSSGSDGQTERMTLSRRPDVTRTKWTMMSRQSHSVLTMTPTLASGRILASGSSIRPVGMTSAGRVQSTTPYNGLSGSSFYRRMTSNPVSARYSTSLAATRVYGTTYPRGGSTSKPRGSTANYFSRTSYKGRSVRVTNTPWSSGMMTPRNTYPGSSYRVSSSSSYRIPTTTMFWVTKTGYDGSITTTNMMKTTPPSTTTNRLGFVTGWESSTKTSSKTQKQVNLLALWICLGLLLGILAAIITACLLRNYLKKMAKWKQVQGVEKKLQDVEMVDFSTNVIYKENKTYKDRSQQGYPTANPYRENPLFDTGENEDRAGKQENLGIEYLTY